jgi:hypothetical protein
MASGDGNRHRIAAARRFLESMTSSFAMTNISYLIHVQMTNSAMARAMR